ncbi:hypothetical protein [Corynebacterium sp. HMSC29G08]|uniref:hypothetical protein n=1 Tax=Corynebacterium sp. HMSC29G08 TaxID=1581069 RepID=UPI0008A33FEF|nr:hypothetical protein [Corynebacterium sp. HMSC29G08]OFT82468.1 hypothetical protein HMPREF3101_07295 [Corynebacterium sp. HMSC29G08]
MTEPDDTVTSAVREMERKLDRTSSDLTELTGAMHTVLEHVNKSHVEHFDAISAAYLKEPRYPFRLRAFLALKRIAGHDEALLGRMLELYLADHRTIGAEPGEQTIAKCFHHLFAAKGAQRHWDAMAQSADMEDLESLKTEFFTAEQRLDTWVKPWIPGMTRREFLAERSRPRDDSSIFAEADALGLRRADRTAHAAGLPVPVNDVNPPSEATITDERLAQYVDGLPTVIELRVNDSEFFDAIRPYFTPEHDGFFSTIENYYRLFPSHRHRFLEQLTGMAGGREEYLDRLAQLYLLDPCMGVVKGRFAYTFFNEGSQRHWDLLANTTESYDDVVWLSSRARSFSDTLAERGITSWVRTLDGEAVSPQQALETVPEEARFEWDTTASIVARAAGLPWPVPTRHGSLSDDVLEQYAVGFADVLRLPEFTMFEKDSVIATVWEFTKAKHSRFFDAFETYYLQVPTSRFRNRIFFAMEKVVGSKEKFLDRMLELYNLDHRTLGDHSDRETYKEYFHQLFAAKGKQRHWDAIAETADCERDLSMLRLFADKYARRHEKLGIDAWIPVLVDTGGAGDTAGVDEEFQRLVELYLAEPRFNVRIRTLAHLDRLAGWDEDHLDRLLELYLQDHRTLDCPLNREVVKEHFQYIFARKGQQRHWDAMARTAEDRADSTMLALLAPKAAHRTDTEIDPWLPDFSGDAGSVDRDAQQAFVDLHIAPIT